MDCLAVYDVSAYVAFLIMSALVLHRYESDETPMMEYLGLHHALHARRLVAQQGDFTKGPRVLVSLNPCAYHEAAH